jgi:DNA-binding response OmpR family regulator
VSDAGDGAGMRAACEREVIHLVLLDLIMPPLYPAAFRNSDYHVDREGRLIDRVVGLETGADD